MVPLYFQHTFSQPQLYTLMLIDHFDNVMVTVVYQDFLMPNVNYRVDVIPLVDHRPEKGRESEIEIIYLFNVKNKINRLRKSTTTKFYYFNIFIPFSLPD